MNKHSRAILEKYADIPFKDNKALPVISNQKMSTYIKELGKLAGIDTPVRITQYRGNERIDHVYPKYELLCANRIKKSGVIDKAITQCGRKIIVDSELALQLADRQPRC